ncbi:MAG TPA: PH domain-containing protein [Rhodanobacteraceae bacterium]|nr:PH domain-containing protein [Rhodanobacteraceae bacterium]
MASYIEQSLAPGEKIVALFRLHWLVWLRMWAVLALGAVIVIAILWLGASGSGGASFSGTWWIALAVAIVAVVIALYQWLTLRTIEQGVTNHRVIRKTGVVSRQSTELRLASIETVDLRQSFWGRIFRFGNVEITGRGETAMFLERLADPIGVKRAIETAYSGYAEGARTGAGAAT